MCPHWSWQGDAARPFGPPASRAAAVATGGRGAAPGPPHRCAPGGATHRCGRRPRHAGGACRLRRGAGPPAPQRRGAGPRGRERHRRAVARHLRPHGGPRRRRRHRRPPPTPAAGGFKSLPARIIGRPLRRRERPPARKEECDKHFPPGQFSTRKRGALTSILWPRCRTGTRQYDALALANPWAIRRAKARDKQQRSSRIEFGGPVEVEASEADAKVAQSVRDMDGVTVYACHGTILPRSWSRGQRSWPGPRGWDRGSSTMAEHQAAVRRCYTFLPLLPQVRRAVPDPADRSARRCSAFLPLPPSTRGCRPIQDVLPEVMSSTGDRV